MVVWHDFIMVNVKQMLILIRKAQSGLTAKLSSGYHINRVADNVAGLYISEKMRKLVRGFKQASLNTQDEIMMAQ